MARAEQRTVYETLVRRHSADLFRFAYRLVGKIQEAEDLVQETYYQAWRSIGSLRDPEAGRAWLLTILRRQWARELDRGSRGPAIGAQDPDDSASPFPGPDLDLLAKREHVQGAIDRLDPRWKEPFLLVFLTGLSCREAADCLSIPLGTVLSRIHRARTALRGYLREAGEPGATSSDAPRSERGGAQ